MKAAFFTLGCKVNQYETYAMEELFKKNGYSLVSFDEPADIYVINTCTVTNVSDRKSRKMIRRAKNINKNAIIAVVGCYAQVAPGEVAKMEEVDLIIGTKDKGSIMAYLDEYLTDYHKTGMKMNTVDCEKFNGKLGGKPGSKFGDFNRLNDFDDLALTHFEDRTRAFLKIQDGCDSFCTYCIVPYARGRIRSMPSEKVIEKSKLLVETGFKEIVLTGIHISSYGKDFEEQNFDLIRVMEEMGKIEGLERIRLGSLEPGYIDESVLKRLKKIRPFCEHFHLSLQSGCDKILNKMNRKYTKEDYRQKVGLIRKYFPEAAVTTDIIVGFPGEEEDDFMETKAFAEEMKFSRIHIFKYSPRENTKAAGFPGQIDESVKDDRSRELTALERMMCNEFMMNFTGQAYDVLIEKKRSDGKYEGHTRNYIKIFMDSEEDVIGRIKRAMIGDLYEDGAIGEISP